MNNSCSTDLPTHRSPPISDITLSQRVGVCTLYSLLFYFFRNLRDETGAASRAAMTGAAERRPTASPETPLSATPLPAS